MINCRFLLFEIEFRIKQSTELTEYLQGHDKFFKWVNSLAFIYIGKYWVSVKIRGFDSPPNCSWSVLSVPSISSEVLEVSNFIVAILY